jgi:DNA-binding transcriptional regulator LsrR (DeoR family)
MSQTEIGLTLGGLSQSHVSRLLAHAEKERYLIIEQRLAVERITPEALREMGELLSPPGLGRALEDLAKATGLRTPNVRVFKSGPGTTPDAMRIRRNRFARTAAGRLDELLQGARVVGVAWGRTIRALAGGLASMPTASPDNNVVQFVPVCAELVSLVQKGYSSSRLAELLDDAYNRGRGEPLQMTGFPAYIPRHYDKKTQTSIRRFVADSPNYGRVFSGSEPLIDQMDALITSVGSSRSPVYGSMAELVLAGGVEEKRLRQLVVGDLGGILIPQPTLSQDDTRLVDELNAMWTGIRIEHVKAIAKRAANDPSRTGVIVAALRAERGDTVFELIRNELVNELILDDDAAARLEQRIADESTLPAGIQI